MTTPTTPTTLVPDDKDWTWVLERPCPDCGFDASAITGADVAGQLRTAVATLRSAVLAPGSDRRPQPDVWSALEYGCHVRDACIVFGTRLASMRHVDDPQFANWDQDQTAVESRYDEQDPATVSVELVEAAADVAAIYAGVGDDQWQRPGRRSNGSVFTVETLGVYHLHDVVHHLHDLGR